MRSVLVPPRASAMLEALRGMGYSTETALADIIDNSIAAGADRVALAFNWDGPHSSISVVDNGVGMSQPELAAAMRLGHLSPLDARRPSDLGRFGLGLKTASLSQARRLTVASRRRAGPLSAYRWDLDVIAQSADDGWHLLEVPADDAAALAAPLADAPSGTAVVWEAMDRVVGDGRREQPFLDVIDGVERHLAMTYHRYLEGAPSRLQISINGRKVAPWDPYLDRHPASWSSPVERLATDGGTIEVQCHVLPHKDRMGGAEYAAAAGPEGWAAHQGFYVYRNERLILPGSWLGLGIRRAWIKDEAHRLARIRLDLPNTADVEWRIDIRKATAHPPLAVRSRLAHLAEDTRRRARNVFAHRAGDGPSGNLELPLWRTEHSGSRVRYFVDRGHPLVAAALQGGGPQSQAVEALLRVVEQTLPVRRIWLDAAEEEERAGAGWGHGTPEDARALLRDVYGTLTTVGGLSPRAAVQLLGRMEPFDTYPQLVAELLGDEAGAMH